MNPLAPAAACPSEVEVLRRRIAELEAEHAEHRLVQQALARRVELERMLSNISQSFIHGSPDELDAQLNATLAMLGSFLGVARGSVFLLNAERSRFSASHEWAMPGAPSLRDATRDVAISDLEWAWRRLFRGEAVEVVHVEGLPAPAHGVRAWLERRQTLSFMAVPVISVGTTMGCLAFERHAGGRAWSEAETTLLRTTADIVSHSIARQRVEAEIHAQLEERVRSRTAALRTSLRELESFSYSVSHDLRAPLRGINGYSHLLLEDYGERLDETGKGYLMRICAASERLGALIDDLLKLSRISRVETQPTRIDLSAIAAEVMQVFAEAEPHRRVETRVASRLFAHGDASLLRVMLENLIGNAWKFTGRKEAGLIEFGAAETERGWAFFVRDDGAGFDPSYAAKLFQPFQRLHQADEFPGSGIGLATVKRIVERHGGTIWAHGAMGGGATFYFTLPSG